MAGENAQCPITKESPALPKTCRSFKNIVIPHQSFPSNANRPSESDARPQHTLFPSEIGIPLKHFQFPGSFAGSYVLREAPKTRKVLPACQHRLHESLKHESCRRSDYTILPNCDTLTFCTKRQRPQVLGQNDKFSVSLLLQINKTLSPDHFAHRVKLMIIIAVHCY